MSNKNLLILLLSIFILRLWLSDQIPLMDTSEARYGEMARKMVVTENWITPMFDHEQPFWGKPPLSFWSQAASISLFGDSEWAVRLPSFIFHLLCCALIFSLMQMQGSKRHGLLACIIYSSSALGFMASGVVLTDPALNFSILLSFYGFWMFARQQTNSMAYLGFAGLGLGLLAKGPIALVLFALPIAFWLALQQHWKLLLQIPWFRGLSITLMLAAPWYWLAEQATPGFLNYFIVGEHFNRYLVSDWAGDKYGDAHARPLGTIWIFLVCALFPWVFYLLLANSWRHMNRLAEKSWRRFLWCWALITPCFFTLAGNILWTYLLPCLAAWAMLLSYPLATHNTAFRLTAMASVVPLLLVALVANQMFINQAMNQKPIISHWHKLNAQQDLPLYYFYKRLYSGEFYSQGQARHVTEVNHLPKEQPFYLALRNKDLAKKSLPAELACEPDGVIINQTTLLRCERIL